jgi:hypothetical protein
MGAWSTSNFDNDDALDWLDDLCESDDDSAIKAALVTVAQWPENEFLESIDCCIALVAAEIVAAALGHPAPDVPEEAEEWLDRNSPDVGTEEVNLARAAVQRILANSELKDFWKSTDSYEEWLEVVRDLENRLP